MRRSHTLPVVALPASAIPVLAGCTVSAAPQPALASQTTSVAANQSAQAHDHSQTPTGPPSSPRNGPLDMRIDPLGPQDIVFQWKPGNLVLQSGQKITLKVANHDDMQHNLLFKAAGVNQNLPVGKTTTISFTAPQAGSYVFWCRYHLQMMQGKVTVQW
jgi:plastocyanin